MTIEMSRFLKRVHISDGAYGTMFARGGSKNNEISEILNITDPQTVLNVHSDYIESGADLITTNTFNANPFRLRQFGLSSKLSDIIKAGAGIAEKAREKCKKDVFICGSIGPSGEFLKPFGEAECEDLYREYSETVKIFNDTAVDLIAIETITDLLELKMILLAVKDHTKKPVIAQMSFNGDKTVTGTGGDAFCILADAMNADIIGMNCVNGVENALKPLNMILSKTQKPVIVQLNAGIPIIKNEKVIYEITASEFAESVNELYKAGVSIIGSCCGSTPKFTRALSERYKNLCPQKRDFKKRSVISDRIKATFFGKGENILIIGEKLNSVTDRKLKKDLENQQYGTLKESSFSQMEAGANALDLNIDGVKNKKEILKDIIFSIQNTVDCPIFLDSVNLNIFNKGLLYIAGKPVLNSIYHKRDLIESAIPLIKRFGCSVVLLSMDEGGVQFDLKKRMLAFEKGYEELLKNGISPHDIIVDPIVTPISSNPEGVEVTLQMIKNLSKKNIPTIIGLSNISIGMPVRSKINAVFLRSAVKNGLTCAIMNPADRKHVELEEIADMISDPKERTSDFIMKYSPLDIKEDEGVLNPKEHLIRSVKLGICEELENILKELLMDGEDPTEIINKILIPEITKMGEEFEKQKVFLPQLIASAKTIQKATEILSPYIKKSKNKTIKKRVLLATVKGDIHDIGKSIVKIIFKGYGYDVIDAGKDVAKEDILRSYKENSCDVIGLSVLMTSTLGSLEETVAYLRKNGVKCPILIGGAVLDESIGKKLGCIYCKDAIYGGRWLQKLQNGE